MTGSTKQTRWVSPQRATALVLSLKEATVVRERVDVGAFGEHDGVRF
jgi:hypothetical protein